MSALAGIFANGPEDARKLTEDMLRALKHRGAETRLAVFEHNGIEGFTATIGYSAHEHPGERFIESDEIALALDGSLFGISQEEQTRLARRYFSRHISPGKATAEVVAKPGAFACLSYSEKRLRAFRDTNGLKPLYYSCTQRLAVFASERKALWKLGMHKVERVKPGFLYSVGPRGLTITRLARPLRPTPRPMTMKQASSELTRLLKRSVRRITKGVDKVAVAFSGGLDSALTAHLARQVHPKTHLFSVGLEGSPELSTVSAYAQELDLPITKETFGADLLEEYVRRVLWLIEEPNLMKVSVAIPLHWAAMVARRHGFNVMLCGQGSDELYGGYYKFARTLDSKGRKALIAELYRSVINAHEVNYERDDQATGPFGVELRTPFSDRDLIRFSLAIPPELKVKPGNDLVRKWVLREVAEKVGLPHDIAWRRKKAIQHGTGVENGIRKLAKGRNLTTDAYLTKIHAEVIKLETMP